MEWTVNKLCIYSILAIHQPLAFDRPQYRRSNQNSSMLNATLEKIVQRLSLLVLTFTVINTDKNLKQPLLVQRLDFSSHFGAIFPFKTQCVTCRQEINGFKTSNQLKNILCNVCSAPDIL